MFGCRKRLDAAFKSLVECINDRVILVDQNRKLQYELDHLKQELAEANDYIKQLEITYMADRIARKGE